MNIYLVHLEAVPTKGSKEYGNISFARVDVFLKSGSQKEAEIRANETLMDHYWSVTKQHFVRKITPERFRLLDTTAQEHYHLCEEHGISLFFAAAPIHERTDNVVYVKPFLDENGSDTTEH